MKKLDFKILTKKTLHFFKMIGSDADKDWKIALMFAVLLLLVIAGYHAKLFIEVESMDTSKLQVNKKSTELIDTNSLNRILGIYDSRASEYATRATSTVFGVDPAR